VVGEDAFAGIGKVRCPVLSWSTPTVIPSRPSRVWSASRGAGAPLETVALEGTGRMPVLERPDAFNIEVGRFLETLGD